MKLEVAEGQLRSGNKILTWFWKMWQKGSRGEKQSVRNFSLPYYDANMSQSLKDNTRNEQNNKMINKLKVFDS